MFRLLILVTLAAATLADPKEVFKKCGRVLHPSNKQCCKMDPPKMSADLERIMKECFQVQGKPPSCDRDICMASKRGYGTDDGTLIKEKAKEFLDTDFPDEPKMIAIVKEKCIDGDLSKFGYPDMCEVMKFKHCSDVQMLSNCPEWSNDGPCEGIKDEVQECIKMFE